VKLCSWCDKTFTPAVSYQIYCSSECREQATKEKIIDRHKVLRRKKRKDKIRMCSGGCGTKLSVYNDETLCNVCSINNKQVIKKIKEIKGLMHDYEDNTK
jgi:hypothetical protein